MNNMERGTYNYYLHTHDLITYRRCRRKWALSSPLRLHLKPRADKIGVNQHLWMGSGFHYAMEECFGHTRFTSPVEAWNAYVQAHPVEERPIEWEELNELCPQMLEYYYNWELKHGTWKTYILPSGEPGVEVNFALEIPNIKFKGESVAFGGTIDRLIEDEHGRIWLLDYKTAKSFNSSKLNMDTQISSYCWAAEKYLGIKIEGMLYVQIHKSPPKPPKITKSGVSTDKRQRTTYDLYKQALINTYGSVSLDDVPEVNLNFLAGLSDKQTSNGDDYVRIDWVERNEFSKQSFEDHMLNMCNEMVNLDLPIYPNPTPDCSWDCPFKDLCLAKEEGSDWEFILDLFEKRDESLGDTEPKWLSNIRKTYPDRFSIKNIK